MAVLSEVTNLLICHECRAVNRAPLGKDLTKGRCARCKGALATQVPVEIDADMLGKLRSRDTGSFIIDVWAPWCSPCRIMAPNYDTAAERLSDFIRFFKLNSDQHQSAASTLGIRGVPTLIAHKNGKQIAHQSGALIGDALTTWIQSTFAVEGSNR